MSTIYCWQSTLKEIILPSLGFEPGSILAFQDLRTTNVATSSPPKMLGHLVEVNQGRLWCTSLITVGRNTLRYSTSHCVLSRWIHGNMRWLVVWEKRQIHQGSRTVNSLLAIYIYMLCKWHEAQSHTTATPSAWAVAMRTTYWWQSTLK